MKTISYITNLKKTIYSFEFLPPLFGYNIHDIFNILYSIIEFNPPFVNITSHIYNDSQNKSRRIGTISICGSIMYKYDINTIPHFLCINFTKQIIIDSLIKLNFLGLYNILILRGDIKKKYKNRIYYNNSIDFVKQIGTLNKFFILMKEIKSNHTYNFSIGVAAYPEKHFEAPNIEEDIFRLYEKIKAGSLYLVTQMFFDNNKYFYYVEIMRFAGIIILIIPGIKPISSINQLKNIPSNFYVKIPCILVQNIIKNKKNIFYIGIEWAIKQSIELKETGHFIIHYYTMNKSDNIYQIVIELINLNSVNKCREPTFLYYNYI